MSVSKKEYALMVKKASPDSAVFSDSLKAFFSGGLLCSLAEGIFIFCSSKGIEEKLGRSIAMLAIVFLTALLTALGFFDVVAKHTGAGTAVPISGFANSIVSCAIEFRAEGFILGVGAKMFTIAGPVIVYGCTAAALYGVIYWLSSIIQGM